MLSKKNRKRHAHENKRAYDTIEEAKRALGSWLAKRRKEGKPIVTMMRAYGCHCGKFHIGSTREINWDLVK